MLLRVLSVLVPLTLLPGCSTAYKAKPITDNHETYDAGSLSIDREFMESIHRNDYTYYLTNRIRGVADAPGDRAESADPAGAHEQRRRARIAAHNARTLKRIYKDEYRLIHLKRDPDADVRSDSPVSIPPNLSALCLSGGGIRSASFNAGVLQGLHEIGVLSEFDYLSSVSGGSYIAGWYMTRYLMADEELFNPSGPQMRYLLANGNYLSAGHAGNTKADIAWKVARHSATIPFHWVLNGAFSLDMNVGAWGGLSMREVYRRSLADTFLSDYSEAFLTDFGTALAADYDRARLMRSPPGFYADKVLDAAEALRPDFVFGPELPPAKPPLTDVLKFALKEAADDDSREIVRLMLEELTLLSEEERKIRLAEIVSEFADTSTLRAMSGDEKRPYYLTRRDLEGSRVRGEPGAWNITDLRIGEDGLIPAVGTELDVFGTRSAPRPFWIANAGLGLRDDQTLFKNQFGDNFEMTPLYCGADAIGYVEADRMHQWMDLSYVLQMSGAAISESNDLLPGVYALMIRALNADLGRYVDSWSYGGRVSYRRLRRVATALYPFHRVLEFFGADLGHKRTVNARKHFISDGGFYENLGALTAIRRGCRTIVISDATADPEYLGGREAGDKALAWAELRRLTLRLRNELGAELVLPLEGQDPYGPVIYGEIRNLPCEGSGSEVVRVIYIKPTYELSDAADFPRFIESYKASEEGRDFPHQATGDQFFGELQLSAYRELGYQTVMRHRASLQGIGHAGVTRSRPGEGF